MQSIRRLAPADRGAAATLCSLFAETADGLGAEAGDLGAWLTDDRNVMIGAWVDGEPAGMVYGYRLPRPDGRADMLLLAP